MKQVMQIMAIEIPYFLKEKFCNRSAVVVAMNVLKKEG